LESAPESTVVTRIKTKREITMKEMVTALSQSMSPIFDDFQQKIESDSEARVLIQVTLKDGKLNLVYGFADPNGQSSFD
jgi:hypothetical protein